MRKLLLLPSLTLALACADGNPVDPVAEPDLVATEHRIQSETYSFEASRDWTCGEAQGCSPGTMDFTETHVTFRDFKARFPLTGELVGDLWVEGWGKISLTSGRGFAVATVMFDLTEPGEGTVSCRAFARYEDYLTEYVEHAEYFACKGTGHFEGTKTLVNLNNENHPGEALLDGTATVWYFQRGPRR